MQSASGRSDLAREKFVLVIARSFERPKLNNRPASVPVPNKRRRPQWRCTGSVVVLAKEGYAPRSSKGTHAPGQAQAKLQAELQAEFQAELQTVGCLNNARSLRP